MIDPFSNTRFHPDLNLETWYPKGVLDAGMAALMADYVGFHERIADEPFDRFTDLSGLTAIHLNFDELADLAAKRRADYHGKPPVKSALLAISQEAYGVARMFAALMESSPIDVRVFRMIDNAAQWLGVPVETLSAEGSSQKSPT